MNGFPQISYPDLVRLLEASRTGEIYFDRDFIRCLLDEINSRAAEVEPGGAYTGTASKRVPEWDRGCFGKVL